MTGTKTAKPSGGVDNAEIQAIVDAIMAPDSAVPDLRDATLKAIDEVTKTFIADGEAAVEFMNMLMSPDKYPSILSYLQSFRRRLIQPLHRDLGQSPYHLWVIVINQVQKEYPIPVQMAMRRLVISNNSRFTFSHDDLIQQMNDLIEDVENVDVKWLKEQ